MNILSFKWLSIALLFVCSTQVYAQLKPPANFKLFFEKVYLHTDRELYAAGDTIWYKAYLTDAQTGGLTTTSANLYIEVISPADSLISRQTILLKGGAANGDYTLPGLLTSGNYRLRAYTNWMRNFDEAFIFEKSITVVSKLNAVPITTHSQAALNEGKPISIKNTVIPEITVRFFPEGGAMVQQLSGLVAVKAEISDGTGLALKGAILALPSNDTVSRFTCDSMGMGLFTLMPIKGQHYQAVYSCYNKPATVPLPAPLTQGPVLKVYRTDTAWIANLSVNTELVIDPAGRNFKLNIKHAGKTYFQHDVTVDSEGHKRIIIPQKLLPPGITCLTLQDGLGRPCCERLIYNEPLLPVKLTLQTDQSAYTTHQKTIVNIQTTNASGKAVKANLSMAVVDATIIPLDERSIATYLMLQSDLKGVIAQPGRYFDTTNVERLKQLDLLLMTQGWRDYLWRRLADTSINLTYAPEQSLALQGKVIEENTGKALHGVNVSLYANQAKGIKLFSGITDTLGRYYFNKIIQYGNSPVTLTAHDLKGKDAGQIIADTAYSELPVKNYLAMSSLKIEEHKKYEALIQRQLAKPLKDTLKLKEVKVNGNKNITLRDVTVTSFGYPDEVLVPGLKENQERTIRDYLLFASKQARYESVSGADENRRLDRIVFYAEGLKLDPRLIVNGYEVPIESVEEFVKNDMYNRYFNLSLSKVERIVIKRMIAPPTLKRARGESAEFMNISGGVESNVTKIDSEPVFIIYLTLKPGALDVEQKGVMHQQINGYYQAREFYKPTYDSPAKANAPDYRTTIHWEPMMQTNALGHASVSYYNADNKGKVRIIIQGVTETGSPVFAVGNYIVN